MSSGRKPGTPLLVWRVWRTVPAPATAMAIITWAAAGLPGLQVALTANIVEGAIEYIDGSASLSAIAVPLLLTAGIACLIQLSSSTATYFSGVASLQFGFVSSMQVMRRATSLGLPDYENPEQYNRLQRAVAETQSGRPFSLLTGFVQVVGSSITVVSVGFALFQWSPLAALIALISPLPAAGVAIFFGSLGWKVQSERAERYRETAYLQWLATTDQAHKDVSHFGLGPQLLERYRNWSTGFLAQDKRILWRQERGLLSANLIGAIGASAALFIAATTVTGVAVAGALAAFLQALGSLGATSRALLMGIASLHQNALFAKNMYVFLDDVEERLPGGELDFPAQVRSGITFENVTFVYPGTDRAVLRDVSFTIPAGRITAVVGENGAGKSTLIKLLARLYQPTSGRILVDGRDLCSFSLSSLQERVGAVFQDFVKFEFSVSENLQFGAVGRSLPPHEVQEALRDVGLGPAVAKLHNGVETRLGRRFDGAEQLSVGHWQRLAVARARIGSRSVLLLDEPSASLDNRAEMNLMGLLRDSSSDLTQLLVTHSSASAGAADHVVVLADGEVVEMGEPGRLLLERGALYDLMSQEDPS